MSLPRIILICGITLCYVTGDGMYRHDSGQQILLVKSMRGGDETDVTEALSAGWCGGRRQPSRPSWRFQAAKVRRLPSKPCKSEMDWADCWNNELNGRRKERNAPGSHFHGSFKLPLVSLPGTSKLLFKCGSAIRCFCLLSSETEREKLINLFWYLPNV